MAATPTSTHHHLRPDHLPNYQIVRVVPQMLARAASRLAADSAPGDRQAGRRFLEAAAHHSLDLSHMSASLDKSGKIGEVCLAIPASGRTATCFTTAPKPGHEPELAAVINHVCRLLDGVLLAQALLETNEQAAARAFQSAGFSHIAELAYMSGPLPLARERAKAAAGAAAHWPAGITVEPCAGIPDSDIVTALERTYIDTLDCPALCDLRKPRDVLASHKATGQHDPAHWRLVRSHGKPEGVALLTRCPQQDAVEIVYLGLGPKLRGQGLGRRLLAETIIGVGQAPESTITCAVDVANTPALKLYQSFGMAALATRKAYVRALQPPASPKSA